MGRARGLVVDFGGVLTTSLGDALRAFCEREGVDHERVTATLRSAYDREDPESLVFRVETGRLDLVEFERELATALSDGMDRRIDPAGLVSRMLADLQLDRQMVGAVRAARRAGVRTALLSNSWGLEPYPRDLLAELFDSVVISGEVGMRKPDPAVFRLAAERLGLTPGRCVFVDDFQPNVEAAGTIGMRGVLHEDTARTIQELEDLLGVPLSDLDGTDTI